MNGIKVAAILGILIFSLGGTDLQSKHTRLTQVLCFRQAVQRSLETYTDTEEWRSEGRPTKVDEQRKSSKGVTPKWTS